MKAKKNILKPTKAITILLLFCIISINSYAQNKIKEFVIGNEIKIKSKILNEELTILISLPDNYKKSDKTFPILYILDGKTHFEHTSAAVRYLSRQRAVPQMIVVAIANIDRNRDFTPIHSEKMKTSGGGKKFHDFITKELHKHIEQNYKTSDYKILMGHSLGGMFAAYSLLEFPDFFDGYIAISPYMQCADNYIVNIAKLKLKNKYKNSNSFYMTVGDEPNYFEPLNKFAALVKEKSADVINFSYKKMKTENHMSIPYLSLYNALRFIFADWTLSKKTIAKGLKAIDEHYKVVSKKYNLEISASENTINFLGYKELQTDNVDKAIKIFKENVKRYSKSANVYDSLGEAYEKNKQYKLAKINYKKAYDLGVLSMHKATLIFKQNYERVSKI